MLFKENLDQPGLDLVASTVDGWSEVVLRDQHGDVIANPAIFKFQDGRYRLSLPGVPAEHFQVDANGRIEVEL